MKRFCVTLVFLLVFCVLTGCGHTHDWKEATCQQARHCATCGEEEGTVLPHTWTDASCETEKTCSQCGITEGTAPGHSWITATCRYPQHCSVCGKNEGVSLPHNWQPASNTVPQMCMDCGEMVPFELPESGTVFIGEELHKGSELTIHASEVEACYVKLKNETGEDVFSFFVRAGESVTAPVPFGNYYVYFAYGTDWYGPEYIFGEDTSYGKDEEICDFENYTWEYTFVKSEEGNFMETPIHADEF